MTTEPKISVIIPIYRTEEYLRKCIDSVIGQTYRNLEIILVDDGSPDRCGEICDEYAKKDSRILVLHTENGGAYAARNAALDRATGEYIGFVDADDFIAPNMYETLLRLISEYKADIAQCNSKNCGDYRQIRTKMLGQTAVYGTPQELGRAFFEETVTHDLLNKLFSAELWKNRRFETAYYHVDAMTLSEIDLFCKRFVRTDEVLYFYNTANESITRGKKTKKHIASAIRLFEAYDRAAQRAGELGSYFICREIPCRGRQILPGGDISREDARRYIAEMHKIFMRHWKSARHCTAYRKEPLPKRLYRHLYARLPSVVYLAVSI